MTPVLILFAAGILLYGFFLAKKFDGFLAKGNFRPRPAAHETKEILLYGAPALLRPISLLLEQNGVGADYSDAPLLCENAAYLYVFALSESDLDNLLLCADARRALRGVKTIARCNNSVYRPLFEKSGVSRVLDLAPSAEQLVAIIKEAS